MIDVHELKTHVWDLRAQLESQLRRISAVQLLTENLATAATTKERREQILSELAEIAAASSIVASIAQQAQSVVDRLPL